MAHRMDVIEAHARRLPRVDDRWTVRPHTREELLDGLRAGKVAGVAAHPLDNVRRNIELLIERLRAKPGPDTARQIAHWQAKLESDAASGKDWVARRRAAALRAIEALERES